MSTNNNINNNKHGCSYCGEEAFTPYYRVTMIYHMRGVIENNDWYYCSKDHMILGETEKMGVQ